MSPKQIFTLVLAATALTAQIAFAAEMPANVQGVQANALNGGVNVSWNPVPGAAFYRVYYSQQSILGNQGNYDDFERTLAAETAFTFAKPPVSSAKMFVGVLAVNAAGVESEGFETEASVELQPAATVSTPEPSPEPEIVVANEPVPTQAMPDGENPTTTAEPMKVVSVEAVSMTGVLVTFSKPIRAGAAINPAFLVITGSGGMQLRINTVDVNATTLLLRTASQEPEYGYVLALLMPIPASDGTNAVPSSETHAFLGFGKKEIKQDANGGIEPPTPTYGPKPTDANPPVNGVEQPAYGKNPILGGSNPLAGFLADPSMLDLRATPRKDGTYDIVASWNGIPNAEHYGLYTAVGGNQFQWNAQVAGNQTTVQYSRVKPGMFGVRVTTRSNQGGESRGIERALNLPSTGLGLLGVMAAAGGIAGARMRRKKASV